MENDGFNSEFLSELNKMKSDRFGDEFLSELNKMKSDRFGNEFLRELDKMEKDGFNDVLLWELGKRKYELDIIFIKNNSQFTIEEKKEFNCLLEQIKIIENKRDELYLEKKKR